MRRSQHTASGYNGSLIGLSARVALPDIAVASLGKDVIYAEVATRILPIGIGGLVMAAAVAGMMSTASGALIAAATVARADVVSFVASWFGKTIYTDDTENPEHDGKANRYWVLGLGIVAVLISMAAQDVVVALTIAYDILVGGLLVAVLGGLVWKRGTGIAAAGRWPSVRSSPCYCLSRTPWESFTAKTASTPTIPSIGAWVPRCFPAS